MKENLTLEEARKLITEPKEGKLLLQINYDKFLCVPQSDGIQILKLLAKGEVLTFAYSKPPSREEISKENLPFSLMSDEEYRTTRMAAILQVSVDEMKIKIKEEESNS